MNIIKGNIASPLGFAADGLHAGFKKKKLDFGWIVSEVPANVAGVFCLLYTSPSPRDD